MSMKVIIADCDWRFAQDAVRFLESHAHLVVQLHSGEEVVEATRHWRPDLVVIAEELAETGILEQIQSFVPRPAVLLVGWADRCSNVWQAWQRGGDELLMKPVFHSGELHDAIVTAMKNAAAGSRPNPLAVPA